MYEITSPISQPSSSNNNILPKQATQNVYIQQTLVTNSFKKNNTNRGGLCFCRFYKYTHSVFFPSRRQWAHGENVDGRRCVWWDCVVVGMYVSSSWRLNVAATPHTFLLAERTMTTTRQVARRMFVVGNFQFGLDEWHFLEFFVVFLG